MITIGAGFDTRPYRLAGGKWSEIDEPQIIDYKNEKLPVEECKNNLKRISINFSNESLRDTLNSLRIDQSPVIVIEGVFMYLEPEAIHSTLMALQDLYPKHVLLCDLMTRNFFEKFAQGIHSKLVTAGGRFTPRPDKPDAIFINNNYKKIENIPMYKRATELGIIRDRLNIPDFVFRLLLKLLVKDLNGYSVVRFHYG